MTGVAQKVSRAPIASQEAFPQVRAHFAATGQDEQPACPEKEPKALKSGKTPGKRL